MAFRGLLINYQFRASVKRLFRLLPGMVKKVENLVVVLTYLDCYISCKKNITKNLLADIMLHPKHNTALMSHCQPEHYKNM